MADLSNKDAKMRQFGLERADIQDWNFEKSIAAQFSARLRTIFAVPESTEPEAISKLLSRLKEKFDGAG